MNEHEEKRLRERLAEYESEAAHWKLWSKRISRILMAIVVCFVALFITFRGISPQLNLYKANTEKKARIAESRAKAEAAAFDAAAEVERARGAAQATEIIAATLTPDYLRYLYIQALAEADSLGQVIYVPTEAGLPILEAGRATK